MDILLQERYLKTLKILSGFSYLTLYDSPKANWELGGGYWFGIGVMSLLVVNLLMLLYWCLG